MGGKPIHLMKAEERNKAVQIEDFFIDTGLPAEQGEKLVRVGDPVTRERQMIEMGNASTASRWTTGSRSSSWSRYSRA